MGRRVRGRWGAAVSVRMLENPCRCSKDPREPPASIADPRRLSYICPGDQALAPPELPRGSALEGRLAASGAAVRSLTPEPPEPRWPGPAPRAVRTQRVWSRVRDSAFPEASWEAVARERTPSGRLGPAAAPRGAPERARQIRFRFCDPLGPAHCLLRVSFSGAAGGSRGGAGAA